MHNNSCVAYDLTRLFTGPIRLTPRGIDRVELGFAKHFLTQWAGPSVATLPTPTGVRTVSREAALRIVESVENNWGERNDPDHDPMMRHLKLALGRGASAGRPIKRRTQVGHLLTASLQMARRVGCAFGPLAADVLPKDTIYINVGQIGIAVPQFLSWLGARPDIKPVFMLHDLIPLEFTDFVPASSSYFHGQMVGNVASYAAGLITTTKSASNAICLELRKRGRSDIPVVVEPLPVSPAFVCGGSADWELTNVPYFVIVSSIEPRKNHMLLLNVWRDLVRLDGSRAPKLVIAGTRWRGHEPVTEMLKRSQTLRNHIVEIGGLTTPSLHRLISHACGLLMPSFAEGFGLPIVEAQALGVPVIASDIAAHREAGGDSVVYLNPTDGPGWLDAVRGLALREPGAMPVITKRSHTWSEYMRRIEPFVQAVGAMERSDIKLTAPASAAATPC